MVPYLTTALTGPLLDLEKRLLDAQPTIEQRVQLLAGNVLMVLGIYFVIVS